MTKSVSSCGQFALSMFLCLVGVVFLVPILLLSYTISHLVHRFPKRDHRPDVKGTYPTDWYALTAKNACTMAAFRIDNDERTIIVMIEADEKIINSQHEDAATMDKIHNVLDEQRLQNSPSLSRHREKAIYVPETTFLHAKHRWFPV